MKQKEQNDGKHTDMEGQEHYGVAFDVPFHLKNNSNTYVNPHNYPGNCVAQEYLPESLRGLKIWEPNNNGWEKTQYEELLRRKEN